VGLDIEVGDVACVSEEIVMENGRVRFHYVIIDFFAKVVGGTLRPNSDALDAMWVPLDSVNELDVVDFVRKLVRRIRKGEGGVFLR